MPQLWIPKGKAGEKRCMFTARWAVSSIRYSLLELFNYFFKPQKLFYIISNSYM